jgi:uncharacterized protein (TIGR00661 family)
LSVKVFKQELKNNPTILVCPLDWGIGHATRCVPVINELLRQEANVVIAASGRPLSFLRVEFPFLQFVDFPGYKFSYSRKGNMALKMFVQIPAILKGIRKEKKLLDEVLKNYKIDGVISDNRYGLSTRKVPCIFITHQLQIKVPRYLAFLRPLLHRLNKHYISQFDECWIPDFADEPNLSGELSHIKFLPHKTYFIGPLSRFIGITGNENKPGGSTQFKYDFLALISGPEPQRTLFEEKIISQLKLNNFSALIAGGKPESRQDVHKEGAVEIYPHLDSDRLRRAIFDSRIVLSRPGYSTIMDLEALGKKAIFIPTPGQTEQEYLADYCLKMNWHYCMSQQKIDLQDALKRSEDFTGIDRINDQAVLKARIAALLNSV